MSTGRRTAIRGRERWELLTLIGSMEKAHRGQHRPGGDVKGVNGIRWTECDEALFTISRVATLLNCVSAAIIQGKLPKETTLDEIGSALGLLYKELEQAHEKLYDKSL